jgi:hypothetical protein
MPPLENLADRPGFDPAKAELHARLVWRLTQYGRQDTRTTKSTKIVRRFVSAS